VSAQVSDQVSDQVRDQVSDQVRAQVRAQVSSQVSDQVSAQVSDQVRAQVRTQVSAQVSDQVSDQVRDQVSDQVRAQVSAQVSSQVSDQVRAQFSPQVRDQVTKIASYWYWGYYDEGWLSYYHAILETGLKLTPEIRERLLSLIDARQSANMFVPFLDLCVLSDNPVGLRRDEQGRLHSDTGAALEYADGWSLYRWHGIQIPERAITDINSFSANEIIKERNAEVRRALMSLYGWERILPEVKAKLIDEHPDPTIGKLYEFALDGQKYHVALVQDGTPMFTKKGKATYRQYAIATRTSLNKIVASLKDTYPLYRDLTDDQYLSIPRT
jgi:Domain of unknown function (DUF6745)